MTRLFHAALVCLFTTMPAWAQTSPVVVELFTSQGCSSCPPADEMMGVLAERDDVIALSLHVDYWDYIGWKDEFAVPANAKRQRGYAMAAGRKSVYTPEMIVNGESDIVGAKPMKLATLIDRHKSKPAQVTLSLVRHGDQVEISAQPLSDDLAPMEVQLLRYQPARRAKITRGENAGRTVHYVNVTQDWRVVTKWNGRKDLTLRTAAPEDLPVVVLIQKSNHGPIIAAAQLP